MTDEQKNFIGIPISGEITRSSTSYTEQRPIEDLQHALKELLEFKSFTSLKWRQYTPYFNDGDACVFGVSEVYIKVPGLDDIGGDYGDGYIDIPNYYDTEPEVIAWAGIKRQGKWNRLTQSVDPITEEDVPPKHPKMLKAAEKVMDMISSGAFNDALLEMFGDHAVITLSAERIEIETYEHD